MPRSGSTAGSIRSRWSLRMQPFARARVARLLLTGVRRYWPSRLPPALPPQTPLTAEAGSKAALESAQKSLGFIPNMYANMANTPGVLRTYLHGYELFRRESGFTPPQQEIVFLTISRLNACTYCVTARSMIADKMSHVSRNILDALQQNKPLPDKKLQALSTLTRVIFQSRGNPTPAQLQEFLAASYSKLPILEIISALAVKTLSNYLNHVFHTKIDAAFLANSWNG